MEIRQLRYFVAVAESGGFGSAARGLHIVQAAVSQQIQRLERSLGVMLFDRSGRRVRLTPAGERLLGEARAVLAAVERTRAVAAEVAAEARQSLRLGTTRAFDARTYELLDDLARNAPALRVRLHRLAPDARLAAVRSGELDAAIVRVLDGAPGLDFTRLWTDGLIVAVPPGHPLAGHERLRLGQLEGLPLRLAPPRNNPAFHELIMSACRDAGFVPPPGPPVRGDVARDRHRGALLDGVLPARRSAPGTTCRPAPPHRPHGHRLPGHPSRAGRHPGGQASGGRGTTPAHVTSATVATATAARVRPSGGHAWARSGIYMMM
ncbi:LysR family transcriptional regulator [Streptomyces sp. NPDC048603]|uniref:LysR family transcriptional regulator n=1 Tax=Streptomyces sp. NPDC048603 TaxID=3365577 RepID=UPI003712A579